MKTMQKLIAQWNRIHPGYPAELDRIDSHKGWYVVYIAGCRRYFDSCRDFRDWMHGVVID